jgi:hypothetical protein
MAPHTVLLIRHAEKPDASCDSRGVDSRGHEAPAELSVTGWQRSGALPRLFSPDQPAEMLPRPDVIFAARSRTGSARPVRTVQLLAALHGLEVRDRYRSEDVDGVVRAIRECAGVVLVCWRHESIASIARSFVGQNAEVPDWDGRRFDMAWVLTAHQGRWTLRQRPQLLLPGDSREPIRAAATARPHA